MTSLRPLTLAALALFALQGCRIEKPSTVVPAAPAIESFTASAATVAAGGKVTLSWKTANATTIELRETSLGELPAATTSLEGSFEATIEQDSVFVLVARGAGGTDARAVSVRLEASAGELSLQALPPAIAGGASSTLVWTAPGASTVTLAAGATMIDTRGQLTSGAVTVSPKVDTTYTLTADGKTKTVAVVVQPAVLTLSASPQAVEVGDTLTLAWTAAGAERLVISSPGRGQLAEITDAARILQGTFTEAVPALPDNSLLTYEVAAVKGTARLAKSVEVYVGTGLEIVRFDAPPVAAAGATYSVRWQTVAADQVEVKVDGVTVHRAGASSLSAGQFSFTAPMQDFALELVASNARGARTSQLAQVDAVGVPTAVTLTAAPTTVTAGQPVTLTWASTEARRVRITDSLGQNVFSTTGQRAEAGTFTVYPMSDTTWTISADNMLGNPPVTATASATVTGTGVTVAQYPPTALTGQNVQLTTSAPMAVLYGFPHARVLESTQADFIDIRSTGAKVIEASDVTTVDLPFTTFLWGRRTTGTLTISRAGWFAWGSGLTVNVTEQTLPSTSTSAPPGVIAAYWDDLRLTANSGVYVQLVGDAPDQQLVVQWDRMQCGTTTGTEATFQARVHQDGRVSFHYLTMNLNTSPSYAIGVQDFTRTLAVRSTSGVPASNTARYFFSPVTPPVEVRVTRGSSWGGYVKVGDAKTLVTGTASAIAVPTDLSLTELMFRPAQAVPSGQYIELINRTQAPLDLSGWELRNPTGGAFVAPMGFTLTPQAPYVLGASTDPALNDDAGVMMAWGTFSLSPDAGSFTVGTADASVGYTYSGPADGGFGTAIEVDPGPIIGTSGSPGIAACAATTTFGGQLPQQLGSPGVERGCFPYKLLSIPSKYVDISDAGTALPNGENVMTPVTLGVTGDPLPVIFGAPAPVISVNTAGYVRVGSFTSGTYSNKTVAGSSNAGSIAPFWDDLDANLANAGVYWKKFEAGEDPATPARHWVVQWAHYSYWIGTDDMNFEAKFFEDGVIEYHYGTMVSSSSSNYALGTSATVWLENPAGTQALVVNINTSFPAPILPNTAYRFVPR